MLFQMSAIVKGLLQDQLFVVTQVLFKCAVVHDAFLVLMMVIFNLELVLDELRVSTLGLVVVVLIVALACCVCDIYIIFGIL